MPSIQVQNDEHWHQLRKAHVGSSDIACLLKLSNRKTRWQLWHEKCGTLPAVDLDDLTHVRNGKYFEPAIAQIGAEKFGIRLRKVRRYLECDDCPALGVSVDYEEIGTGNLCPTEIKWSTHGLGWDWEGDTVTEAPDEYLIQVQAQLACMPNAPYGRLWAFVAGDVRQMIVQPRPRIIAKIKEIAAEFMADVVAGREPPVDFNLDGGALDRLAAIRPLISVDWRENEAAIAMASRYNKAARLLKKIEAAKDAAKAVLVKMLLDEAEKHGAKADDEKIRGDLPDLTLAITTVAANPGRIITQDMLGEVIGERQGYRRFAIKPVKKERQNGAHHEGAGGKKGNRQRQDPGPHGGEAEGCDGDSAA